jgi:DNA-binding SARP family transcriptional activator
VWFLCAALQKQAEDYKAARSSLQQAWELAKKYELPQVSIWSAWGTTAMSYLQGDEQQAGRDLAWLKQQLSDQGDWVTANIVHLMRRTILHQTQERLGIRVSLGWLRRWGEMPASLDAAGSLAAGKSQPSNGRIFANGFLLGLRQKLGSIGGTLKRIASGKLRLKWVEKAGSAGNPPQIQGAASTAIRPSTFLSGTRKPNPSPDQASKTPPAGAPSLVDPAGIGSPGTGLDPAAAASLGEDHTSPAPTLIVYTLGTLRVYRQGRLLDGWTSKKGQSIFKYLLLHRDTPAQKEILMDLFWPDTDPESARRNLHQAIYALRGTLNLKELDFQHIQFRDDHYRLNPNLNIWMDSEEFERHVKAGQRLEAARKVEAAMAEYGVAEGLYQDDFLVEDLYESWCQSHRRYLQQTYIAIALRLAKHYLTNNEVPPAIALCRSILKKDPCQEEAHQLMMRSYLKQGQRYLAINQYQHCVQVLNDELGLAPSSQTQELYRQIEGDGRSMK